VQAKYSTQTIDDYFKNTPKNIRPILTKIRTIVHKEVPTATETIKYQLPTFVLNGKNLVHFGAFKNHIGFYPTPSGIEKFKKELSKYKCSKGSVQFPFDDVPYDLVQRIVVYTLGSLIENADNS
jgi:uncharacterized protein YdhG (YjbR/CyaY superfamily)